MGGVAILVLLSFLADFVFSVYVQTSARVFVIYLIFFADFYCIIFNTMKNWVTISVKNTLGFLRFIGIIHFRSQDLRKPKQRKNQTRLKRQRERNDANEQFSLQNNSRNLRTSSTNNSIWWVPRDNKWRPPLISPRHK